MSYEGPARRIHLDGFVPAPPELAEQYRREGLWEGRTLGELFDGWVSRSPNELALIGTTVDGAQERLTYAELQVRVNNLAAHLQARGIGLGSRVVVRLPNVPGFVTLLFALFKIGALPVLALPVHGEREILHLIEHSAATAYAVAREFKGADCLGPAQLLREDRSGLEHLLVSGTVNDPGVVDLDALERTPAPAAVLAGPGPSDVALLLLSGGTTETPKLIPRTHDDYALFFREGARLCGFSPRTVYLAALPAGHNFPLASPGILGTLHSGGRVVMTPAADPDTALDLIEKEKVTVTSLVPPLAIRWMESPRFASRRVSSLELLQVGAQQFQPEHARLIRSKLRCTLQQVFGRAEGLMSLTRLDDPEKVVLETQGRPLLPHDEIRIVDDQDQPIPDGVTGHLHVRGPYTIHGYFRAPEQNALAFTADGFFRTGDLVRRDGPNLVVEGLTDRPTSALYRDIAVFALLRAARAVEARLENALVEVGLSWKKLGLLTMLVEADEALPLGQLAGDLACVPANITHLVNQLEAAGLVQRAVDKSDRRTVLALITRAGRQKQAEGAGIAERVESSIMAALPYSERVVLAQTLAHLLREMEQDVSSLLRTLAGLHRSRRRAGGREVTPVA